ncbi:hypothetical protein R1flu_018881 [Riccia fluitans]|uniref:Reverse transcriptase/retrotransposon-derived protein RNase H-like domain-containing protein n=1 Tax=Riccia fluitans TaxID=41844 RepID=A0ABD1ZH43_9MARC
MSERILLGHRISVRGIEVDKEKVAIIVELQPPQNSRGVRAFLGSTGYYRHFVWKYADKANPLTTLLKKKVKWRWGAGEQAAFKKLKKELTSALTLVPPNWEKSFHVYMDTSAFAIGVILSQQDDAKRDHPIYFSGKKLSDAKRKYTTTEREALGMIFFVRISEVDELRGEAGVFEEANFVKSCDACQRMCRPMASTRWPLVPIMPLAPFERWGIDFIVLKKVTQVYIHEWDQKIPSVLLAFKTAQEMTTKHTSYFLCYGLEPILPIEMEIPMLRLQVEERGSRDDSVAEREVALVKLEEE